MSAPSPSVAIKDHTTASHPRPHILYNIRVVRGRNETVLAKRYSDFITLHNDLKDPFTLPPKRILATSFVPSAWVDDELIAERKNGLQEYLTELFQSPEYVNKPALVNFLKPTNGATPTEETFNMEDALPSTLSKGTSGALARKAKALAPGNDVSTAASFIAAAYYPDWVVDSNPPESIDFSKFDVIFFAFATPSSSAGLSFDSGSTSILKRLVTAAKNSGHGTKVCLSVGGWGGCQYYSYSVSTSSTRAAFVKALSSAVSTYGLDGIDLDWEYPNNSGAGQPYSSSDSANLLTMITSLRSSLGSSKIISAAVTQQPWLGSNGSPLKDVSKYAAQMTYVNIMNYDTWGASSNPGPNAPLGNLCGTSDIPSASAEAAFASWTAAGFPASKLVLGMPLYGYVSKSTKTTLTGSFVDPSTIVNTDGVTASNVERRAHAPPVMKESSAGDMKAAAGDLSGWWGQQIPFNSLLASGALKKNSDGTYTGANGYTMAWDNCSDTPFLFNTSRTTVVTYDDTYSISDKAAYAKSKSMAGCFTWSLDQDDGVALQNVVRKALGKS